MSRARTIREWLATQDGPRTSAEIAAATGERSGKVNVSIGDMMRSGALAGSGDFPARYSLAAAVKVWRYEDPAVRKAARVLASRKADAKRGDRRRAAAALLAPQRESERAIAKAAGEAKRAAIKAARAAARLARPKPAPKPARVLKLAPCKPVAEARPVVPAMTSAEWIAQGNRPQVLPMGATSEPLRFNSGRLAA